MEVTSETLYIFYTGKYTTVQHNGFATTELDLVSCSTRHQRLHKLLTVFDSDRCFPHMAVTGMLMNVIFIVM